VKPKVIPKKVVGVVGLVDYLKSKHMPSDFYSRRAMAQKYGIKNYSGQAEENIRLLERLRRDNE
jgi:superfamily I DNA and/or RNA helicase